MRIQRYGVSDPTWQQMTARFEGLCWICKAAAAECVDHCHDTGRVRGALCRTCNMLLHYVEHLDWWESASAYLRG
ncbi:endonuclease domain-containing protein [Actinomadura viridis]|uniref:endonuclease domain-containing protein n=1 Tax=Actinomadura viridis TaxID=58110 RepID=UPI00367983B4